MMDARLQTRVQGCGWDAAATHCHSGWQAQLRPAHDRRLQMARVAAPGGTVAATIWGERRNCGWAEVFPIVAARVASEVCPMFFGTGAFSNCL